MNRNGVVVYILWEKQASSDTVINKVIENGDL